MVDEDNDYERKLREISDWMDLQQIKAHSARDFVAAYELREQLEAMVEKHGAEMVEQMLDAVKRKRP
ncbi:hypothetical protein [Sinorhizobium meliloti]|uniref:hypothetical protein n=1 Tax=Rhizobium meliloti TaxID=382 RepID=UPI0003DBA18F|nr:hypothetical protein [Sinorhizobium meliloti]ARS70854.1 hypothetical protein SMRU11_28130 [Sinorhizobium meliloti RU11/001]RVM38487.1 hypothetical protein CN129_07455 [Sinorhizobium meliloti]